MQKPLQAHIISSIVFLIVFEPSYNQEWLRVSNCHHGESVFKRQPINIYEVPAVGTRYFVERAGLFYFIIYFLST